MTFGKLCTLYLYLVQKQVEYEALAPQILGIVCIMYNKK